MRVPKRYYFLFTCLLLQCTSSVLAQQKDTSRVLEHVIVIGAKKQNTFTSVTPAQSLSIESLQQINAPTVGDAVRFFSGVLVKDYGGVGGLKTISVRSLGASQTGIVYDGVPVSDAQTGQIDLSRYSSTFIQSLQLYQASMPQLPLPARSYSSTAILAINTEAFRISNMARPHWQAGLRAGSFGLWQPSAGISTRLSHRTFFNLNTEGILSEGDYPVFINNGSSSENTRRSNSKVRSFQGESNILHLFSDSATLQVKLGGYVSKRGLPGAIVFFNDRSVEQLWNNDYYAQARYLKNWRSNTSLLVNAKYTHNYTRYTDPDYLNNQGGLDNQYRQQEWYGSAAISHSIREHFEIAVASDIAASSLRADLQNFADPSRISLWNNIALNYVRNNWQLNGSLLYTGIFDYTRKNGHVDRSKFTPSLAFSIKPAAESPFMFRAFYKHVFRMPTFNDLYYNFIGNSSLRPEYAQQYNAGIVFTRSFSNTVKEVNLSVDGYYNTIKDKIVAVPNKNLFVWTMLNLGKVHITGIDLTTELHGNISHSLRWFTRIAYTWQRAIDVTDPAEQGYKDRIPYTPDHSGSGILTLAYKSWSAGYSALFSGNRYTMGGNNPYNQLQGWATQDVSVSRSLTLHNVKAHIKAELNNLADKRYDVVRYFPMPGRSFKISLLLNSL